MYRPCLQGHVGPWQRTTAWDHSTLLLSFRQREFLLRGFWFFSSDQNKVLALAGFT